MTLLLDRTDRGHRLLADLERAARSGQLGALDPATEAWLREELEVYGIPAHELDAALEIPRQRSL